MLIVKKYTTGIMQTNVYFALNEETKACVILDPGANAGKIIDIVEKTLHAHPEAVLLTHGHFDHILAAEEVAKHFGVPIYAGEKERETLARPLENMSADFGLNITIEEYEPLKDGDSLELAGASWKVLETPGHTVGSISFFIENEGKPLAFTGDTLFSESFGRTDLPGGNEKMLFHSILEKLFTLPDDTMVYPGHEMESMISHEKKFNPVVYLSKMKPGGFAI